MVFIVFWFGLVWFLLDLSFTIWIILINLHGVSAFALWLDFTLNFNVSKKSNVKFPLIFAFVYGVFNFSWVILANHDPIYPILKWNDVLSYILIVVISLIIYMIHT